MHPYPTRGMYRYLPTYLSSPRDPDQSSNPKDRPRDHTYEGANPYPPLIDGARYVCMWSKLRREAKRTLLQLGALGNVRLARTPNVTIRETRGGGGGG